MHPSDFDRYSLRELVNKKKGFDELQEEEWIKTRILCFYAGAGRLKKSIKKPEDLFSLPSDKKIKRTKGNKVAKFRKL